MNVKYNASGVKLINKQRKIFIFFFDSRRGSPLWVPQKRVKSEKSNLQFNFAMFLSVFSLLWGTHKGPMVVQIRLVVACEATQKTCKNSPPTKEGCPKGGVVFINSL